VTRKYVETKESKQLRKHVSPFLRRFQPVLLILAGQEPKLACMNPSCGMAR